MKVVWLTKSSSKYKMNLLNEIGKKVNLTVLFIEDKTEIRGGDFYGNLTGNFTLINLIDTCKIKKYIKNADVFIDSYYASFFGFYFTGIAKKYHIPTILYADGGIATKKTFFIEKIISFFMNRHDYILSSSSITDEYFKYYLKNNMKKVYHYHISSLDEKDIKNNRHYLFKKQKFKNMLNLELFTFISVGQPIPRKGFDILLKAYAKTCLNNKTKLLIIGGKPYDELKTLKKELNLSNVEFIDAIPKNELAKYYAASDAFVFTTREDIWGLVVNEALSFGLPLISSDNSVAAKHFKMNEDVGILVKNEDIEGYAKAMLGVYSNPELRKQLSNSSLKKIKSYTIENSAKDILDALHNIVESRSECKNVNYQKNIEL